MAQQKYVEAVEEIMGVLELEPDCEEARPVLKDIMQVKPMIFELHKAAFYLETGQYLACLGVYSGVEEQYPGCVEAREGRGRLLDMGVGRLLGSRGVGEGGCL